MSRPLLIVLLVTLAVRGAALWVERDDLHADVDNYRALAENLARHGTFGQGEQPTAFRPPLYPLLLAAVVPWVGVAGIAALHLLLGLATVALVYRIGHELGGPIYGTLAALLTAFDPILLEQQSKVMTETFATFLATAALAALVRAGVTGSAPRFSLAGALLGAASLARPTFLLWGALVIATLPCLSAPPRQRFLRPALCALGLAAVLSPWLIRNQLVFGQPIAGTTHGGFTLLLANNPDFYDHVARQFASAQAWDASEFNRQMGPQLGRRDTPARELASNARAYELARANIDQHRAAFLQATAYRVLKLWSPRPQVTGSESPSRRVLRLAVAAFYLVEYLLLLVGLFLPLARPVRWWVLLLALALTATHAFYWSDMRMRSVIMPGVALVAAAPLATAGLRQHGRATGTPRTT